MIPKFFPADFETLANRAYKWMPFSLVLRLDMAGHGVSHFHSRLTLDPGKKITANPAEQISAVIFLQVCPESLV